MGTRFVAPEIKLTTLPSPLMAGKMLSPFDEAAETPGGRLAKAIAGVQALVLVIPSQVFRTKMFSTPLVTVTPKLVAFEENATN